MKQVAGGQSCVSSRAASRQLVTKPQTLTNDFPLVRPSVLKLPDAAISKPLKCSTLNASLNFGGCEQRV